jgi:hypothetical protein
MNSGQQSQMCCARLPQSWFAAGMSKCFCSSPPRQTTCWMQCQFDVCC